MNVTVTVPAQIVGAVSKGITEIVWVGIAFGSGMALFYIVEWILEWIKRRWIGVNKFHDSYPLRATNIFVYIFIFGMIWILFRIWTTLYEITTSSIVELLSFAGVAFAYLIKDTLVDTRSKQSIRSVFDPNKVYEVFFTSNLSVRGFRGKPSHFVDGFLLFKEVKIYFTNNKEIEEDEYYVHTEQLKKSSFCPSSGPSKTSSSSYYLSTNGSVEY